jgi:hypothetical protein
MLFCDILCSPVIPRVPRYSRVASPCPSSSAPLFPSQFFCARWTGLSALSRSPTLSHTLPHSLLRSHMLYHASIRSYRVPRHSRITLCAPHLPQTNFFERSSPSGERLTERVWRSPALSYALSRSLTLSHDLLCLLDYPDT